jgi:hypothetical protein
MPSSLPFSGILYRDWRTLHGFTRASAPARRRRARWILLRSLLNEAMHALDSRFERVREQRPLQPPLVVLGLARSGTTYLYHLLCQDPSLAYPTWSQVYNPHTFLTREGHTRGPASQALRALNWLFSRWEYGRSSPPADRGFDRVRVTPATPEEDEFALLNCGQSRLLPFLFPLQAESLLAMERKELWQGSWLGFLRKLGGIHPGRRLVLKSPWHMARVPWILELFPEAKFVFISREPGQVLRSSMAMHQMALLTALQDLGGGPESQRRFAEWAAFASAREQILSYLEHRALIPAGHLHELRYEDLRRDPEGELEKLYRALSLPGYETSLPRFREALRERADYQVNAHAELSQSQRERLRTEWGPYYEAFGYS